MASGFFAILDDISSLLDDVATASKVASQKTAGILGDDLAVNAEKATGFVSSREIPVLWAITKGSFVNKLIIVPIALLLNVFFPVAINYVLMAGGCFLAYEGVEKVFEYFLHKKHKENEHKVEVPEEETSEKQKIKSAIATDFILSLEIVIIALGSVLNQPLSVQITTVCIVAVLATVGVYGIVAMIVRMDDAGFRLINRFNNKGFFAGIGRFLVRALPVVIKSLGVIGTLALLSVSGGIFVHNIEFLHHLLPQVPGLFKDFGIGIVVGTLVFLVVSLVEMTIGLVKN